MMNCSFTSPGYVSEDLIIYWMKMESQNSDIVIYSFYHSREQRDKVHTVYQNRTLALQTGHSRGDCSVVLKHTATRDAGTYSVYVKTGRDYRERRTRLEVTDDLSDDAQTRTLTSSDGLVNISSQLPVRDAPQQTYTCTVINPRLTPHLQTSTTLP
eukprot:g18238.t1